MRTIDGVSQPCASCGSAFDAPPRAPLQSPRIYCSTKCKKRAAYLRRKDRLATARIVTTQPRPCNLDGWPIEEKLND